MQIDYTALRSVQGGHSATTAYAINVDLSQSDKQIKNTGVQTMALDGSTVTTIHRSETIYSITTELCSTSTTPSLDDMREFLDSVSRGETFQMDVSGTSIDYILDSFESPYSETRENPNYFRFSFAARAI